MLMNERQKPKLTKHEPRPEQAKGQLGTSQETRLKNQLIKNKE
jgi:hypothetical protein